METIQFECRKCKKTTKQVILKVTDNKIEPMFNVYLSTPLKKQLADTERGIENMLWRVLRLTFADFAEFIFHILLKQRKAGL